ncbi:MAG: P-loop NTPase fold protein [Campylobacterota bacterium]|nr:P-loop NTPase fold protein [Campylobacterota bacterium]
MDIKDFDKHIGLRDEFKKELEILIKASSSRVTLFIDDIDRCKDEEILEIIQTVNYLSSVDNLYIIMAIDQNKVIDAIARQYRTLYGENKDNNYLEEARKYIQKIFNITIHLPTLDGEFLKDERFKLSKLDKKLYTILCRLRKVRDVIMNYSFVVILTTVVYFQSDRIVDFYIENTSEYRYTQEVDREVEKTVLPKPLDVKDENISPPNTERVESNVVSQKSFALPASREKPSIIESINWIYPIFGASLFLSLIILILKQKKRDKEQDDYILDKTNELVGTTARERNMIYNQVKPELCNRELKI